MKDSDEENSDKEITQVIKFIKRQVSVTHNPINTLHKNLKKDLNETHNTLSEDETIQRSGSRPRERSQAFNLQ